MIGGLSGVRLGGMSQEIEVPPSVSRRRRWTRERKAQLLQAFAASGIGPAAFCREHGIPQTSFGRWRRLSAERRANSRWCNCPGT
ncbi:MAG: IS66 family insertion sequence element accessory protein TnpA [Gemmatimonadaceae bacterium]